MQFTQSLQITLNSTTKNQRLRMLSKIITQLSEDLKGQMFFVIFFTCLHVLSHTSVKVVANKKPPSIQMKIIEK